MKATVESAKQVEEEAAAWIVRRDSRTWTTRDQLALDEWLESSTAHVVAFIRLDTVWQNLHRLKALDPTANPFTSRDLLRADAQMRVAGNADGRRSKLGRGFPIVRLAAAAIFTVVIAAGIYLRAQGSSYRTSVGGIASLPLTDGSNVTLNTDSEIHVNLTDTERRIQLDQGEAFFQVAKDPQRPFIVIVGDRRVIAVGTAFSVRRDHEDVQVVVTEGKVRFEDNNNESDVVLQAGSIARSRRNEVLLEQKPVPDVDDALSWRSGVLTFKETMLTDAVAEFNRYNTRKIVLEDSAIASIRLSGKFQSTHLDAFIRLLEDVFPVDAERVDDRIVLRSR